MPLWGTDERPRAARPVASEAPFWTAPAGEVRLWSRTRVSGTSQRSRSKAPASRPARGPHEPPDPGGAMTANRRRPEGRRHRAGFSTCVVRQCAGARSVGAQTAPNRAILLRQPRRARRSFTVGRAHEHPTRQTRQVTAAAPQSGGADAARPHFPARREANRRRYSRKLKHEPERESDDAEGSLRAPEVP